MKKLDLKKLGKQFKLGMLSSSLVLVALSGCGKNNEDEDYNSNNNPTIVINTSKDLHPVVKYFEKEKVILDDFISANDLEPISSKGRIAFTEFTDFIFYDKEVEGYKYDDLDDETKQQVYRKFCYIDYLVCTYDPDYKNELDYEHIKLTEYISKDYYNKVPEIKEFITPKKIDKIYSEEDVLNYFTSEKADLNKYINLGDQETAYALGNTIFQEIGDFIFKDTVVCNYKYSELSLYAQREINKKLYHLKYVLNTNGIDYKDLESKYPDANYYGEIIEDEEEVSLYDTITVIDADTEQFERVLSESNNIEDWYCEYISEDNSSDVKVYKIKYKEK